MKLRTAIKVMRRVHCWDLKSKFHRYRRGTILRAQSICRRKEGRDDRVPFIPSDEEQDEQAGVLLDILSGIVLGGGIMGFDESILSPEVPEEVLAAKRKEYFNLRYPPSTGLVEVPL